jgi:AcrR family transcriptional regulator
MPYRRTDNVARKLAARHEAIVSAAQALAAEGGMAAVQIAPVAERAGIAAGTVYRYFPAKTELVAALVGTLAESEIAALARAAEAAPGPLSALAAVIATFAARALANQELAFALLAEPFERRIRAAMAGGHLPAQDAALAAPALLGALIEGLIGPLAPAAENAATADTQVQALTLLALRALGLADTRARGLVVQVKLPPG